MTRIQLVDLCGARCGDKGDISDLSLFADDKVAYDAIRATVTAEQHKIAQARSLIAQRAAQVVAARSAPQQLSDARAKSDSSMGQVNQTQADVRIAELNLRYTKIYAPVSGVIGRKTVELGRFPP